MTELDRFYTALPFAIATDRLKNAKVNGVNITVKPVDSHEVDFHLDLRKKTPLGITLTMAHLDGTLQQGKDGKTQVSYQTHPLPRHSNVIIPAIGIILTVILLFTLSPELAPIASVPGIAGVLFALFWNMLNGDVLANDRFRLTELLERMLEKQSSMATWQM
jgi:hypothetical protein